MAQKELQWSQGIFNHLPQDTRAPHVHCKLNNAGYDLGKQHATALPLEHITNVIRRLLVWPICTTAERVPKYWQGPIQSMRMAHPSKTTAQCCRQLLWKGKLLYDLFQNHTLFFHVRTSWSREALPVPSQNAKKLLYIFTYNVSAVKLLWKHVQGPITIDLLEQDITYKHNSFNNSNKRKKTSW